MALGPMLRKYHRSYLVTNKEQASLREEVIRYVSVGLPNNKRDFYTSTRMLLESHKRQKSIICDRDMDMTVVWRPRNISEWLKLFPKWW